MIQMSTNFKLFLKSIDKTLPLDLVRPYIWTLDMDRKARHERFFSDYFAPKPMYPPETFRRRFRMGRHGFIHIVEALSNIDPYFRQMVDAISKKGLSSLQQCTASMHILAYGASADAVDDYVQIGESTTIECLRKFVEDVILVFETEHL